MMLTAAFDIVRSKGIEAVSVRNIARALECSTQPVTYLVPTTNELMEELYRMADAYYHARYVRTWSASALKMR